MKNRPDGLDILGSELCRCEYELCRNDKDLCMFEGQVCKGIYAMPACWHIMLVTLEGQVMGNILVLVKNYKYIFIYEDK